MRSSLQMQTGHQLMMTPLLQRSIQLLQLSSLEFLQEIQESLSSNPFLDAGDTDDGEQAAPSPDDVPAAAEAAEPAAAEPVLEHDDGGWTETGSEHRNGSASDGDDEWDPTLQVPITPTLREHLLRQAGCLPLDGRDRRLVEIVIEALDTSGYLVQPLDELAEMFGEDGRPDHAELSIALRHVQAMDPPGVGAQTVAECLRLQLAAIDEDETGRECALRIVTEHLDLFAARDFQRLQRVLDCDEKTLGEATVLIRKLTPRPGAAFGADDTQFVVADVIVQQAKGKWTVSINPQVVPKIRLNQVYASILQGARDGSSAQVSQQLQEARWLVRNIEQRFSTIQRVAQAIVDRQSRYFEYGEVAMKPLTLRDIAEAVGLHESTVSRVTSRKYMATPRGLLEFKRFFGSHVESAEGSPLSSTAVRAVIRQLIAAEDTKSPLSDIKLTRLLEQRGIKVARRTVAKYRDLLQIPPVDIRRLSYRQSA